MAVENGTDKEGPDLHLTNRLFGGHLLKHDYFWDRDEEGTPVLGVAPRPACGPVLRPLLLSHGR